MSKTLDSPAAKYLRYKQRSQRRNLSCCRLHGIFVVFAKSLGPSISVVICNYFVASLKSHFTICIEVILHRIFKVGTIGFDVLAVFATSNKLSNSPRMCYIQRLDPFLCSGVWFIGKFAEILCCN